MFQNWVRGHHASFAQEAANSNVSISSSFRAYGFLISGWMLGEAFLEPLSVCFELSPLPSVLPREERWRTPIPHIKYCMYSLKLGELVSESHPLSLKDKKLYLLFWQSGRFKGLVILHFWSLSGQGLPEQGLPTRCGHRIKEN